MNNKKEGLFWSLEGGEGAGKGMLIKKIIEFLIENNIEFVSTREPGGTDVAEKIREIIVHEEIDGITEALLFASARRHHVENLIKPAINKGKLVLCDRFIDSSLVYQGYGRGLGVDTVWEINKFAIGDFLPDKTIYLDIAPEVGLKRISDNNRETNRLDLEGLDFYNKNRQGYLDLANKYPERFVVINADQTPDEVFNELKEKLLNDLIK